MIAHCAIRGLMHEAALTADEDLTGPYDRRSRYRSRGSPIGL
jgi:hypothetical protein